MKYNVYSPRPVLALLVLVLLSGCAGSSAYMKDVPEETASFAPSAGKALVTFMRPSGIGFAVQSTVFDVTAGKTEFIGIVSAKTKIAYEVEPGDHHFMVVGESADFIGATVEADKHYYALVTPRMGVWKARFSLRPVTGVELKSDQFADWFDECRWVENTGQSYEWAKNNRDSILAKQQEYWEVWSQKPDQPILRPNDGA